MRSRDEIRASAEMLARLERGEGIKRTARELRVDRKTVKAQRARGQWRARPAGAHRRGLDAFRAFLRNSWGTPSASRPTTTATGTPGGQPPGIIRGSLRSVQSSTPSMVGTEAVVVVSVRPLLGENQTNSFGP